MYKLLALLLISTPCFADPWSTGDTYREGTYLGLLAIDWAQTRNCLRLPMCYEQNPLLGKHPEQSHLDTAVILTGIGHYLIAKTIPENYRVSFQYISIGIEGLNDASNFHIGVKIKF